LHTKNIEEKAEKKKEKETRMKEANDIHLRKK
jgi:hypothetical protein